jgi:hypothetical protein
MKKYWIPIIVVFISGCASNEVGHSKDVNQDEICQTFSISYDEKTDKTQVVSFFRFAGPDGTTLILDDPSKVELNGSAIEAKRTNGRGSFYQQITDGKVTDKFNFRFTDIDGKKFENSVAFRDMAIEQLPAQVKRSEPLVIHFVQKPEGRDDNITVMIHDDSTTVMERYDFVLLDRIKFPKEKLQQLHGHAKMEIRRYSRSSLKQHTHAGGYIVTEFVLEDREFDMVD